MRLTSWLFTQRGRGAELGATRTNPDSGGVEDLNQRPLDFKSSALNHSVMPPPVQLLQTNK